STAAQITPRSNNTITASTLRSLLGDRTTPGRRAGGSCANETAPGRQARGRADLRAREALEPELAVERVGPVGALGRRRRAGQRLGAPVGAAPTAGLLPQGDLADRHAPVDRLAHVVDGQAGDRAGRHGLHLDAGAVDGV